MLYGFDEDLGYYYAPKRRRAPDNPYRLHRKEDGSFWVAFTDGAGREQEVQVDAFLFSLFNTFELEDLSQMNRAERHLEQTEQRDETLYHRSSSEEMSMEEQLEIKMQAEEIRQNFSILTDTQRRRLLLYLDGYTYAQIGLMEGCSYQKIQKSVYAALKKLQEKEKFTK